MDASRRRWIRALSAATLVVAAIRHAGGAPVEVHGASDAFAEAGIALAWAVLRGADEQSTQVRLHLRVDPARHPRLAVVGRDPFSAAEQVLLPAAPTPATGRIELAVARAHFADFPRTEIRLDAAAGAGPGRTIYYNGVPDTTPEFTSATALDAYVDARLARLGRPPGSSP